MAGMVHFKFKSQITYDSVSFDGHFVSIGELKTLIAEKRGIGRDASAELALIDPQSQTEYADDAVLVPKSSSVLVKRTPQARAPALQGASAPLPVAALGARRAGTPPAGAPAGQDDLGGELYGQAPGGGSGAAADEDAALDSMLRAAGSAWQREVAAGARGRGRGGRGRGRGPVDPDYLCKRCGQRGHWISACPTNGDPAYDRKVIPMGIPMTRLGRAEGGKLLLPNGEVGSLMPNEDAFAREMAASGLLQRGAPTAAAPAANGVAASSSAAAVAAVPAQGSLAAPPGSAQALAAPLPAAAPAQPAAAPPPVGATAGGTGAGAAPVEDAPAGACGAVVVYGGQAEAPPKLAGDDEFLQALVEPLARAPQPAAPLGAPGARPGGAGWGLPLLPPLPGGLPGMGLPRGGLLAGPGALAFGMGGGMGGGLGGGDADAPLSREEFARLQAEARRAREAGGGAARKRPRRRRRSPSRSPSRRRGSRRRSCSRSCSADAGRRRRRQASRERPRDSRERGGREHASERRPPRDGRSGAAVSDAGASPRAGARARAASSAGAPGGADTAEKSARGRADEGGRADAKAGDDGGRRHKRRRAEPVHADAPRRGSQRHAARQQARPCGGGIRAARAAVSARRA